MNEDLRDAANQEAVAIAILIVVLILSPIIIFLVRNAVATIQLYAANLALKAKELKREKKKSDSLLFQMLPPSIATQLKQTRQVSSIFSSFPSVKKFQKLIFIEMKAFCIYSIFFKTFYCLISILFKLIIQMIFFHRKCMSNYWFVKSNCRILKLVSRIRQYFQNFIEFPVFFI